MAGSVFFTHSERTQKNYTVNDAVKFAQAYLRARNLAMCVNSIPISLDTPITLVDLNFISTEIVEESSYYNVPL